MKREIGRIRNVTVDRFGSTLLADAAIGATVIYVDDVTDFSEEGGSLTNGDETIAYTAIDDTLNAITVEPLATGWVAEQFVAVSPATVEYVAHVIIDDHGDEGGGALAARIPHNLFAALETASRETTGAEWVTIIDAEDGAGWIVTDILGREPSWDGSVFDPPTVPGASDGEPPAISPPATALGGLGYIAITWTPISNHDPVTVKVYGSDVSGFPVDATTYLEEINGSLLFVKKLTDGTPLEYEDPDAPGTPKVYYFRTVAVDEDGEAAPSAEVSASMVPANTPDVAVGAIIAGHILAGQITSELLAAVIVVAGIIRSGAEDGQRVETTPEGIEARDPLNNLLCLIPTDPSKPVQITGQLVANTLTTLGLTQIGGDVSLGRATTTTLETGIVAPNAPAVAIDWASLALSVPNKGVSYGLFNDGTYWYSVDSYLGAGYVRQWSSAGALIDSYVLGKFTPYGITKSGTKFYILGVNSGGDMVVRRYTTSFDYDDAVWTYAAWSGRGPALGVVTISGTDYLLICEADVGNADKITIRRYSLAGALQETVATAVTAGTDMAYVARGSFDFGAARYVVAKHGATTDNFRVFDTSGVEQTNEKFPPPNGQCHGAWWNGTIFQTLIGSVIYDHTTTTWTSESSLWWLSTTWRDSDAGGSGTHETDQGGRATLTMKRRARLTVSSATIPDAGGADDPDSIRVYIGRGASDPGRTGMWQNASPAAGVTAVTISSVAFSGTNPPAANDFPAATPAKIVSALNGLELDGAGLLRLAQYTTAGLPSGVAGQIVHDTDVDHPKFFNGNWMPIPPLVMADYELNYPGGSVNTDTLAITFPVAFQHAPKVLVGARNTATASNARTIHTSVTGTISTTGFTARGYMADGSSPASGQKAPGTYIASGTG